MENKNYLQLNKNAKFLLNAPVLSNKLSIVIPLNNRPSNIKRSEIKLWLLECKEKEKDIITFLKLDGLRLFLKYKFKDNKDLRKFLKDSFNIKLHEDRVLVLFNKELITIKDRNGRLIDLENGIFIIDIKNDKFCITNQSYLYQPVLKSYSKAFWIHEPEELFIKRAGLNIEQCRDVKEKELESVCRSIFLKDTFDIYFKNNYLVNPSFNKMNILFIMDNENQLFINTMALLFTCKLSLDKQVNSIEWTLNNKIQITYIDNTHLNYKLHDIIDFDKVYTQWQMQKYTSQIKIFGKGLMELESKVKAYSDITLRNIEILNRTSDDKEDLDNQVEPKQHFLRSLLSNYTTPKMQDFYQRYNVDYHVLWKKRMDQESQQIGEMIEQLILKNRILIFALSQINIGKHIIRYLEAVYFKLNLLLKDIIDYQQGFTSFIQFLINQTKLNQWLNYNSLLAHNRRFINECLQFEVLTIVKFLNQHLQGDIINSHFIRLNDCKRFDNNFIEALNCVADEPLLLESKELLPSIQELINSCIESSLGLNTPS